MGWEWSISLTSYLPDRYKETAIILRETPEMGYVYKWVSVREKVWNQIEEIRNRP